MSDVAQREPRELKLSEQMRICIALNDKVELDREHAIRLMKVVENIERDNADIQALSATMIQRQNRRDDLMMVVVRDIAITCCIAACVGVLL